MASEIDAYGAMVTIRRPLAIVGLNVLTLGVYGAVWYYRVNAELRDYGRAYRDSALASSSPRRALLAFVPGLILLLPPLISLIGFVGKVRRAQRYGRSELASGWLVAVLVLSLVFIPAIPGYVQSTLNELWRRYTASVGAELATATAPVDELTDHALAAAPPPHPPTALA